MGRSRCTYIEAWSRWESTRQHKFLSLVKSFYFSRIFRNFSYYFIVILLVDFNFFGRVVGSNPSFYRNWIYNFAGSRDDNLKQYVKISGLIFFSTLWKFSNYFGRTPQRYETLQTPDVELKAASEVKTSAAIRSTTEHQKSAI